jgi:uncharacterized iron-regulated membrane protein
MATASGTTPSTGTSVQATSGGVDSTTTTLPAGATVPITTTFTSSSQQCVATLEAQVLTNGATAVVMAGEDFVTLNHTCSSMTTTTASIHRNMSTSHFSGSSSSSYFPISSASESAFAASDNSGTSPGMIAGLVLGVVAVLSCAIGAGFWFWLRRRRNSTTVFTAKAKILEEDRSGEISIRWEKDSAEIKESDASEIKEMCAPVPVEMGDGRSIVEPDTTPLSPISIDTTDGRDTLYGEDIDAIVSPLSPNR